MLDKLWEWLRDTVLANFGTIAAWLNGIVTFLLAATAVHDRVRHRERLEVRVISLTQYWWSWDEEQVEECNRGPYAGAIEMGDPRRIFAVMEFEVINHHKKQVSVGRFLIEDWIYADHYQQGMYDRARDYRVFDLFTRERVSLDQFRLLEPGDALGLRLEILDQGYHPAHNMPMHRPAKPILYDEYKVQFHTDLSHKHAHTFRVPEERRYLIDDPYRLQQPNRAERSEASDWRIYRWSDDLLPESNHHRNAFGFRALPQATSQKGWELPDTDSSRAFSVEGLIKIGRPTDAEDTGSVFKRVWRLGKQVWKSGQKAEE